MSAQSTESEEEDDEEHFDPVLFLRGASDEFFSDDDDDDDDDYEDYDGYSSRKMCLDGGEDEPDFSWLQFLKPTRNRLKKSEEHVMKGQRL